jgi:ATP-binding cassette subfamily B protein
MIVVLKAGRIVETGSHSELLELGGEYAKLHRIQFAQGREEPAPEADVALVPPSAGDTGEEQ